MCVCVYVRPPGRRARGATAAFLGRAAARHERVHLLDTPPETHSHKHTKNTHAQADKKALLTKTMLQEVKDAADKRRGEDDSLRSLAAGCPVAATLQADLTYDYADT